MTAAAMLPLPAFVYMVRASGEGSSDYRLCRNELEVRRAYVDLVVGADDHHHYEEIEQTMQAFRDPDEWSGDGIRIELYMASFEVWRFPSSALELAGELLEVSVESADPVAITVAMWWLRAALDCGGFHWDGQQHEAAEGGYREAIRQLSAVRSEGTYQARVDAFMQECFGLVTCANVAERNHRFLEEALELVQACGCSVAEARQLVEYVYNRPPGEPHQECGGVMVTLAGVCNANRLNMRRAAEDELQRVRGLIPLIRKKHAAKPKLSPLPGAVDILADCETSGAAAITYPVNAVLEHEDEEPDVDSMLVIKDASGRMLDCEEIASALNASFLKGAR